MSELKVTGAIKEILPIQSGESAKGQWKKVEFVVSNNEGYKGNEQLFCFQIFGAERVDKFLEYNKVGDSVDVKFNVKTNQHKGRYYTNLDAYGVYGVQGQGTAKPVNQPTQEPVDEQQDSEGLDLPF